ncbi:hypothetical protein L1887_35129 [Cichorium endivia]|nr:hypothetical protein L1887_35129 [Cichorium endivia]
MAVTKIQNHLLDELVDKSIWLETDGAGDEDDYIGGGDEFEADDEGGVEHIWTDLYIVQRKISYIHRLFP